MVQPDSELITHTTRHPIVSEQRISNNEDDKNSSRKSPREKRTQSIYENLKEYIRSFSRKDKTGIINRPTTERIKPFAYSEEENYLLGNITRATIRGDNISSTTESLLDNHNLTILLSSEKKTSPTVEQECRKICEYIKSRSRHIRYVEATYTENEPNTVIFLVFAEKEIKIETEWKTELRIVNKFSDESRTVLYHADNNPLPRMTSRKVAKIINKNSKSLMDKHKYLSSISASSVISSCFGTDDHTIEKKPCITLNVLVKGLIPLDEKPFPRELDGIATDVRESGVHFCGNLAKDVHTNVKIGCQVTSSTYSRKRGTIGGFIEHPEYGLCGITCAHVVLNDEQKAKFKKKLTDINEVDTIDIYQPDKNDEYAIGKVVEVKFKEGENDSPGVDLALFKIERRAPKIGDFPYCHMTVPCEPLKMFMTGRVWGKTGIPTGQKDVQKVGCVSGHTKGIIVNDELAVRIPYDSKTPPPYNESNAILLDKQYHIRSSHEDIPFSLQGDSGALVFMIDKSGEELNLRCIGMVVGGMGDNTSVVTPITALLADLKVDKLKSFSIMDMIKSLCE